MQHDACPDQQTTTAPMRNFSDTEEQVDGPFFFPYENILIIIRQAEPVLISEENGCSVVRVIISMMPAAFGTDHPVRKSEQSASSRFSCKHTSHMAEYLSIQGSSNHCTSPSCCRIEVTIDRRSCRMSLTRHYNRQITIIFGRLFSQTTLLIISLEGFSIPILFSQVGHDVGSFIEISINLDSDWPASVFPTTHHHLNVGATHFYGI